MHDEGGHAVASAVEARGGFLGKPTLAVLIVSMSSDCRTICYLVFAT